jgi:hypothetical protein
MTPMLREFLFNIRSHAAFNELVSIIPKPRIHTFRLSDADKSETARSRWIYESGQLDQHKEWLSLLTGETKEKL